MELLQKDLKIVSSDNVKVAMCSLPLSVKVSIRNSFILLVSQNLKRFRKWGSLYIDVRL